jgi:hypothetical protein
LKRAQGFRRERKAFIGSFSDLLNKGGWFMAASRRVVEVAISDQEAADLARVGRSRTEPASRVSRARMLLAYRETPSFCTVGRAIGVTHQTVERCLRRAERLGVMAALDDSPRPGREPVITEEARTLGVDLACRKAKDLGYPQLAKHVREHGPNVGRACLAKLAQGALCKILAAHGVKPHKARYYLERRDPEFDAKMAEVLCVHEIFRRNCQESTDKGLSRLFESFSTLGARPLSQPEASQQLRPAVRYVTPEFPSPSPTGRT